MLDCPARCVFGHGLFHALPYSESVPHYGESNEGRMADALAHGGDEGRDKLR